MNIEQFTKISENKNLTFKEIWPIIDGQFETIRQILINLGDKFWIEEHKDSTNPRIKLAHPYLKGTLLVYINGVIQWAGQNYKEVTNTSIELLSERKKEDVIKVIIIHSNLDVGKFNSNVETAYDEETETLIINNDNF